MSEGIERYMEETCGMTPEERGYFNSEFVEDTDEILDNITRDNDRMSKDSDIDMGLYDE